MDWSRIHLPPHFWTKAGVVAGIVVVLVIAVRLIQRSNKIFLLIFMAMVGGLLFFNWVYNRNEPKFLTPIIAPIADSGFFPSKGVDRPQTGDLDTPGRNGSSRH